MSFKISESNSFSYSICNTFGKEIKVGIAGNSTEISFLNSGVYFIIFTEIGSGERSITKLIVK
jgi:hypothetical protein